MGKALGRFPQARGKTFLLGETVPGSRSQLVEIEDPYLGGPEEIRECYRRLVEATTILTNALSTNPEEHARHATDAAAST